MVRWTDEVLVCVRRSGGAGAAGAVADPDADLEDAGVGVRDGADDVEGAEGGAVGAVGGVGDQHRLLQCPGSWTFVRPSDSTIAECVCLGNRIVYISSPGVVEVATMRSL